MKLDSYWTDSAPAFVPRARELPAQVDVAIVGGGFTGLSAALALAQARRQGRRAGGRRARGSRGVGPQRRPRQQRAGGGLRRGRGQGRRRAGARLVPRLRRRGRHGRAAGARRGHRLRLPAPRQAQARHAAEPDGRARTQRRAPDRRRRRHRCRDPRRGARARRGAERALPWRPALQAQRPDAHGPLRAGPGGSGRAQRRADSHGHRACSASSAWAGARRTGCTRAAAPCSAQQVLLATGATRHGGYGSFGWLRRRIVPIGSFIVVTEPLGAERAQALLRGAAHLHDGGQHPPLLPAHRRPPAGVRRARALRGLQPAVRCRERRDPARRAGRNLSAAARRAARLLLGRTGRHDAGPPATRRRARRPVLLDGLQRPRHADVGADGRAHGRRDGGRCVGQPVARPRLARDPGPLRAAVVPARGRACTTA